MDITTHLLVQNHSHLIESTLKSILPLGGNIVVGSIQPDEETLNICRKYGAKIISLNFNGNFSKARNELISTSKSPWQFYIHPGEILINHDFFFSLQSPQAYSVQIYQGDIITKELRLWHKSLLLKFTQPVYETISSKSEKLSNITIYSPGVEEDWSQRLRIIDQWKQDNPLSVEPHYYKAFIFLNQKKYKDFINEASTYLFHDNQGMPSIMMQYYLSLVHLHMGQYQLASRGIVSCIVSKPLMAEFWCLLGDIYYKIKQYKKAIYYYENALILGKRRINSDLWPIEISKYKKYPNKMIDSCKDILTKSKLLTKQNI